MQEKYYRNKLYPFQDKILSIIIKCKNNFYLTGGTALGRFYLNHRYSDVIDLFLNDAKDFNIQTKRILDKIKTKEINFEIVSKSDNFQRIICSEKQIELKIDFVNDVNYYSGELVEFKIFPRVDNLKNILVNKITALDRREPKDVADILLISRNYNFNWSEIITEALKKVDFIDPVEISIILKEFPGEFLNKILWVEKPDITKAVNDIKIIAKDILTKNFNSLH